MAIAGCGLGAGASPTGVQLTVTREFGARLLGHAGTPHVVGQETVMSLLVRNDHVSTRYGGGFVQSINGLSGGHEKGHPVDWFYYVNGIEASQGAAETNVHHGDHVWWDLHDWSATEDIPAVVGSFPEPFVHGIDGKRLAIRVECASVQSDPCRTVSARLHALGIDPTVGSIGGTSQTDALHVLVGPWSALSEDPLVQSVEGGPSASGIYARFSKHGETLTLLEENGQPARTLASKAGLIAATRSGEGPPVWIVTGTDSQGVQSAAQAFDQADLHDHFAVALSGSVSPISVPVMQP